MKQLHDRLTCVSRCFVKEHIPARVLPAVDEPKGRRAADPAPDPLAKDLREYAGRPPAEPDRGTGGREGVREQQRVFAASAGVCETALQSDPDLIRPPRLQAIDRDDQLHALR